MIKSYKTSIERILYLCSLEPDAATDPVQKSAVNRLTGNKNDGSRRVGGKTGGFQLLGAELSHLEVDGEECFVRADEVVGFCINDGDDAACWQWLVGT